MNWNLLGRTLLITVLSLGLFGSSAQPIHSQGAISPSLSVNPSIVRKSVKPGQTSELSIALTNLGNDPIPLGIAKFDIKRISDEGAPVLTGELGPRSAATWIELPKPELIVDAGKSEAIPVKITPPATVAPGGYTASLVFQARLPSYYFDVDAQARILPALSVSFLLSVETANPPGIDSLRLKSLTTPKIVVSSPIPLVAEVQNPTNFFFFADGSITLDPIFGASKKISDLEHSVLLPDSSRKYVTAYSGSIWPGVYQATVAFNQGDQTILAASRFVAIPWQFLLIVAGGVSIVVFLLGRKRFRRAWLVLSGKTSPTPPNRPIIR